MQVIDQRHNFISDIDIESVMGLSDPYPVYAALREKHPVCKLKPNNSWVVSRYKEVISVLDNPVIFSSEGYKSLLQPDWLGCKSERGNFLVFEPPSSHMLHRKMASRAFTNNVIDSLVPFIREAAQSLVTGLSKKENINFIEYFSYPYVCKIISRITGTDEIGRLENIREWVTLGESISLSKPSDERITEIKLALTKQNQYFDLVINDRKNNPRSDLIGRLVSAKVDGQFMTDSLLRSAMELLISASFQTTVHMLSNCMIQLSRNPDILGLLVKSPEKIPDFVEEMLRFNPPGHCLLRKTTREVSLSGVRIPKGELIIALLASANRDPAEFYSPDEFIMGRNNAKQHLAFGYGIHLCIGANLARLEVKIALEEILKVFRKISCPNDSEIHWANSFTTHGPQALPITFE